MKWSMREATGPDVCRNFAGDSTVTSRSPAIGVDFAGYAARRTADVKWAQKAPCGSGGLGERTQERRPSMRGYLDVRATIKRLSWRPLLQALLASNRRAGLILVYHDVADRDGDPRLELVPPISRVTFERHLRHLQSRYRLVELEDLPGAVANRR